MPRRRFPGILFALFAFAGGAALFASDGERPLPRPPSVPLVTHDPYFSIWSPSDRLADGWPVHWTGRPHALSALVRVDGKPFRVMGRGPWGSTPMTQTGLEVFPTRTVYVFADAGVELTLTFLCPLLPSDLDVLSRPVTYITAGVRSTDGAGHDVQLYLDASAEIAVNTPDQKVVWGRLAVPGLEVLSFGSRDQRLLEKRGDDLRIDWGYFYLAVPRDLRPVTRLGSSGACRESFWNDGWADEVADEADMPRSVSEGYPVAAAGFVLDKVGAEPASRRWILAYDDRFSIEHFHRKLRPYWRRTGWEASQLLRQAALDYDKLAAACREFDVALLAALTGAGGAKYAWIATLAFRQSIAAHKLAVDVDGTPLFFPKENCSNGCIATVDVIYPSAPLYLYLSPPLMKAMLRPVFDYAASGRWPFPVAPHDLGTYPHANGQVYGGGEESEEDQMPVEESGNMLILAAALARAEESVEFLRPYEPLLRCWAEFLKDKGLDPENQLCTDDFAGHLAHNANLSLKAILGLRAYADLAGRLGKKAEAKAYAATAARFASEWLRLADDGDHYRLAFDKPGTWSQKYNLVWDRILGYNLFPAAVADKEMAYYRKSQNRYGLPLDNRKDYTKLDWVLWTACLTGRADDFAAL
ncbi:MAG: DUF4965 domain-containing protein, partial [Candidatus Aminicenantes bacterium]|nr:DUF4965 domain-containing protein [Candidatus Aminicenantes bacterium]